MLQLQYQLELLSKMGTIDKSKIDEAERRLIKAMKQSNIADLNKLLHDDLLFVIPTGDTITKEMDLENYRSGHMQIDSLTTDNQ